MVAEDLIGIWSADAMYGPGAQSDDVLVFKEDGSGFLEFANPVTCFAELFRWSIEPTGELRLQGYRVMQLNQDCTAVEELESSLNVVVPFTVAVEDTKAGRRMPVLRLARRLWSGIADHYGHCRSDTAGCEQPDFSWLQKASGRTRRST